MFFSQKYLSSQMLSTFIVHHTEHSPFLQHDMRDSASRAGSSAIAETCGTIPACGRQTDRQTGTAGYNMYRVSIASRGKTSVIEKICYLLSITLVRWIEGVERVGNGEGASTSHPTRRSGGLGAL